jgi:hypothetical protein
MKTNLPAWGVALAACGPLLATAQAGKTEPPKASPQLTYQSAFADYKPYKDAPLANWRELNDTAAAAPAGAGGHTGHSMGDMKGMEMPAASTPSGSASMPMKPMTMTMPMPMHNGHPKHGVKQ